MDNNIYGMPNEIINVYNGICSIKNITIDELKYNINKIYYSIIGK